MAHRHRFQMTDRPRTSGRHIAYWRKRPKSGANAMPLAPLEPLSTGQITGLIVVATLIASLLLLSAGWWYSALHH
jgi:hypothetical protein